MFILKKKSQQTNNYQRRWISCPYSIYVYWTVFDHSPVDKYELFQLLSEDEREFLKSGNLPENSKDEFDDLDISPKTQLYEVIMPMIRANIFTLENMILLSSKFKIFNHAQGKTIKEWDSNGFNWIKRQINTTSASTNNFEDFFGITQPIDPRKSLAHLEIQDEYDG